jgi:general stress protein 26
MTTRRKVLDFLKKQGLAVISTIDSNDNKPEAALVAFAETEELEIIFQTFDDTRKYNNIKSNPKVAFVIGFGEKEHITVQYEGLAVELEGADKEKYKKIFMAKKTPCTEEYLNNRKSRVFKVSPTWIGYSDYTKEEPEILEIKAIE